MGSATPVDAELEILKSRTNAEKVVQQLHLNWRIIDRPEDVTFRILEFISSAEDPSYTVELTGNGGYTVLDAEDKQGRKRPQRSAAARQGADPAADKTHRKKGETFGLQILPFNGTVAALRRKDQRLRGGKKDQHHLGHLYRYQSDSRPATW